MVCLPQPHSITPVATRPEDAATRQEREHERDRRARRDAARRNASKGVGPNLEEAIALVRAGKEFGAAFERRR